MNFPDDLTDDQKIKIMSEAKARKEEMEKQARLEKNMIPFWKM